MLPSGSAGTWRWKKDFSYHAYVSRDGTYGMPSFKEDLDMPIYVTLFKNTQRGAETIKDAPQRIAAGAQAVQKAGGRIIGAYATLGSCDYVYITEFPDTKAGWPVLIQTAQQGAVSGETMEAIPIEEFVQMVNRT